MGAPTSVVDTIPLPAWVDTRKVNMDHIVRALYEQQAAAAQIVN
jgi:hypothetical protein